MTPFKFSTRISGPIAVIGDLHGKAGPLSILLDRLRRSPDFAQRWVVFIGDFVDRGPDSKTVIDTILEFARVHPRTTAIMGNHEFAMCSALGWLPGSESHPWAHRWIDHYDSEQTFESYGAPIGDVAELEARIPPEHRDFLTNLPWCVEHPQLLFVHAGLDPNMPFDVQLQILRQKDFSLNRPQWLCEHSFVTSDPPTDCPFTVVSGHVKVESVVIRPRRILVDTTGGGAGDLSCVLMPERLVISSATTPRPVEQSMPHPTTKSPAASSSWWRLWS